MDTKDFIDKDKMLKKHIRTYLMIFMASKQESYLDAATDGFVHLKEVHDEYRQLTGKCPRETILEHQRKEAELKEFTANAVKPIKNEQETETVEENNFNEVIWRKVV